MPCTFGMEGTNSYKINMKLDDLKTRWRVEKAALELAEAQRDLKEVGKGASVACR